jgi:PAS domain-containing protein
MQQILLQIGQVLGLITAGGTALALIFGSSFTGNARKWVIGIWNALFYPFNGTTRKLAHLEKSHEKLAEKLDFIVSQLSPNGGSSLRDAVNRLEKHQRISESKMAQYLDTKDAAIFETDANGLYTWVSKSYEKLVGRPKIELINWGWTVPILGADLESIRYEWDLAVKQKRIFEASYRIERAGVIIHCRCRAIPVLFNDEVVAWTGILVEGDGN